MIVAPDARSRETRSRGFFDGVSAAGTKARPDAVLMRRVRRWKLIRFLLTGTLVVSVAGCDMVYRILQKSGAEEKQILGPIVPGESNPRVREVQKLLKLYGYPIGAPDGILGPTTRRAVGEFQKDNGLKPNRFVDNATWARLHMFDSSGLVKNGEIDVAVLQRDLKKAGVDPGGVDGKLGPKTKRAIKDFQSSAGLKPDGKVGLRTIKALLAAGSRPIPARGTANRTPGKAGK